MRDGLTTFLLGVCTVAGAVVLTGFIGFGLFFVLRG